MDKRRQTNDDGGRGTCEGPKGDSRRLCRVVTGYRSAYPEPFVVQAGECLTAGERESEWSGWIWCTNFEGESRWVPEAFVQRLGETCTALRDYDATELTVNPGQEVIASEEAAGWIWCTDQEGQSGWVPANYLVSEPNVK